MLTQADSTRDRTIRPEPTAVDSRPPPTAPSTSLPVIDDRVIMDHERYLAAMRRRSAQGPPLAEVAVVWALTPGAVRETLRRWVIRAGKFAWAHRWGWMRRNETAGRRHYCNGCSYAEAGRSGQPHCKPPPPLGCDCPEWPLSALDYTTRLRGLGCPIGRFPARVAKTGRAWASTVAAWSAIAAGTVAVVAVAVCAVRLGVVIIRAVVGV